MQRVHNRAVLLLHGGGKASSVRRLWVTPPPGHPGETRPLSGQAFGTPAGPRLLTGDGLPCRAASGVPSVAEGMCVGLPCLPADRLLSSAPLRHSLRPCDPKTDPRSAVGEGGDRTPRAGRRRGGHPHQTGALRRSPCGRYPSPSPHTQASAPVCWTTSRICSSAYTCPCSVGRPATRHAAVKSVPELQGDSKRRSAFDGWLAGIGLGGDARGNPGVGTTWTR